MSQRTTGINHHACCRRSQHRRHPCPVDEQLASYTDCSGKTTQWKYDTFGQLSKFIDAAGEKTEYHYAAGHLSSLVYPDKTRDRFEYDAAGRLLSYVDALHSRTTWSYNEAGLIQQRLNPDDSPLPLTLGPMSSRS